MSAQPSRNRRPPLHERTQSQNNTLAIRVVPYSPPRPDADSRAPSQASSHSQHSPAAAGGTGAGAGAGAEARREAHAAAFGVADDQASVGSDQNGSSRGSSISTKRAVTLSGSCPDPKEGAAGLQGSALPSSAMSALQLVRARDEGVSGAKLVSVSSGESPAQPTAPAVAWPSQVANTAAVHAPALQPYHRGSRSPSPSRPTSSSSASGATPRPFSRRRNFVAIHSDKTFSLVPLAPVSLPQPDYHGGLTSPQPSYTSTSRTSSSHERFSSDYHSDDRPSSPLTSSVTLPDRSLSPLTPSPGSSTTQLVEDPIASSPWNYRMVGGLRKVPKTPDLKQKRALYTTSSPLETPLAPLPEASTTVEPEASSHTLEPQASFSSGNSAQTASTTSETTNYKVYGRSSPAQRSSDSLVPPSSSHSNYQLLGESSPAAPIDSSPPGTSHSNENYVLHGDPSPSSSLVTVSRKPRPTYSQESLLVPPLRPRKKNSYEKFGYYKSRSRESLRGRAGSIKSIGSIHSISSVISREAAQAFFAAPLLVNLQASSSAGPSSRPPDSWAASQATGATPAPVSIPVPRIPMQAHPHQWSSQLSTVASESEGGSSRALSRSVSPVSAPGNSGGRRSSTGWAGSVHSRQLQSISSSLAAQLEEGAVSSHSRSHSRSDSLDRPQPAHTRGGPSVAAPMVRDQDEHGDGLADLQQIQHRPSRGGLSGFFSSSNSSDRNLHSSASSRANSFNSASIPAWARLYYGSGERRFFGAPSESTLSESGDSRPPSSVFRGASGSPHADHFPLSIYSQRRRAQEVRPGAQNQPFSDTASMDITPLPPMEDFRIRRSLRRITSSIWSPHLRMDRRASRYSMWEPPSVSWSAESGIMGRRNAQVVLFIAGFIFPFAWMIAAVLPLPAKPTLQMMERNHSDSRVDLPDDFRLITAQDETRYESAKWWRNLNRCMSVVGLLILGAIVALVVVGVREGWARSS